MESNMLMAGGCLLKQIFKYPMTETRNVGGPEVDEGSEVGTTIFPISQSVNMMMTMLKNFKERQDFITKNHAILIN